MALSKTSEKLNNEEIKFIVDEIITNDHDLRKLIGHRIADQKDISFQDMKIISRAYNEYFNINIEKDITVNNIIMAQASRHVIVHRGAEIDERLLKQVSNAKPITLLPELSSSGKLLFSVNNLHIVGDCMINYFMNMRNLVEHQIEGNYGR